MSNGTPLPAALSGTEETRTITIDSALWPYVSGALAWLCDKEPLYQTGALTVEEARVLLAEAYYNFLNS